MTYNDTELLIQKYLNGETTAEEERLLALEVSREDAPEDWKIIAGMLGELAVDEALFDQEMAKRRQKPRIMKLWPWMAAACVAALLIVFLTPPRDEVSPQPQKAQTTVKQQQVPSQVKEEPQTKVAEVKKANHRPKVSKGVAKAPQAPKTEQVAKPENTERTLTKVEESDIIPYDDPFMQFAEQTKALRERGNRVIQRVSMSSLPPDNNPLSNI